MDYSLKDCTINDIDFIVSLKEIGLRWYVEKLYGWDYEKQKEIALNEFNDKSNTTKIITINGNSAGVSILTEKEDYYEVWLIMVHPDYRGKGIASSVINEHINLAKSKQKRIIIKTFKDNPALKLYKKLGFAQYKQSDTHIYLDINF